MPETVAVSRARARKILHALARAYPDARIALHFRSPYELLVATILSAQCTDERVNMVTPGLFRRYPTVRELARAGQARLESEIRSTGFFRAKSRSLLGMAQAIVERHGGEVPREREALTALPGVGLKTANVVIGNAFGGDALAVDTHVFRVSQRLGLARSDDAEEIHDQLVALLPRGRLTQATHLLIVHGRRTCVARRPACPACPVRALCPWPGKTRPGAAGSAAPITTRRSRRS
jgi:endonuclease III